MKLNTPRGCEKTDPKFSKKKPPTPVETHVKNVKDKVHQVMTKK